MFVAPKDVISEVWNGFRWGVEGAEKEFKADKAHSINDFKELLPNYIKDSDDLVFSIGKHQAIEKIVLEIFTQQLENLSRLGVGVHSLKSPDIFLNEMRLIKSEFEIKECERLSKFQLRPMNWLENLSLLRTMKGRFKDL